MIALLALALLGVLVAPAAAQSLPSPIIPPQPIPVVCQKIDNTIICTGGGT